MPRRRSAAKGTTQMPGARREPHVTQLLQMYGEHIGLVVEIMALFVFPFDPNYKILKTRLQERCLNIESIVYLPLQVALLTRHVKCQCSSFEGLAIQNVVVSGSGAEGIHTPPQLPNWQSSSDYDFMLELGPVHWAFQENGKAATGNPAFGPGIAKTSGSGGTSCGVLPRLVIADTENPGFVLLLQEQRDDCSHSDRLPFNAEDVTQFLKDYQKLTLAAGTTQCDQKGPSSPLFSQTDVPFDTQQTDDVPCLHVPIWCISDEFFTRHRQHNWPPEDVMANIRQFGLHLVPVGAPGSKTEKMEWRLSFSRAELLLLWLMTHLQRVTIIVFKMCKTAFGEKGETLKSYYVKTALLWLCEQGEEWTSVHQGVLKLVDFLDEAIRKGELPCFFWSKINLLRFTNRADRKAMKETLKNIKKHFMELMVHELFKAPLDLEMLVRENNTCRILTECQVRTFLTRLILKAYINDSMRMYLTMTSEESLNIFPVLLRSFSGAEVVRLFRRLAQWRVIQNGLFHAFLVAPDDVTSKVRLSSSEAGGLVLNAAPLLALLTEDDLKELLGDPRALRSWLQQRLPEAQRPAGAPTDLRSPRDLYDLLLNTPLLCKALKESLPSFWATVERWEAGGKMALKTWSDSSKFLAMAFTTFFKQYQALEEDQTKLDMDRQTAAQTAGRFAGEMKEILNKPEVAARVQTTRDYLPDPWNLWHFVLARTS